MGKTEGKLKLKLLKRLTAAVLCGVLIAGSAFIYNGYGSSKELRIGLERNYMGVGSVSANNSSLTLDYSGGSLKLSSGSGFTFEPASGSYLTRIQCASLDDALDRGGIAVYDSDGWASYQGTGTAETVTETTTEAVPETEDETADPAEETTQAVTENVPTKTDIPAGYEIVEGAIEVTYGGGSFIINKAGSVTLTSSSGVIDLGEMAYRGEIEITNGGGSLNTVNILSMDEYLYGVVPAEVHSHWPDEALKAQAVAARTYASYHYGKHSGYDLCDTTHCQFYSGYNREETSTNNAVDSTSGVMAYYGGKPINSVYYDCDGGYTLSAQEVWGSDIPYLQSVPDPYEKDARSWERSYTLSQITEMANAEGFDIGSVTNVQVTKWRGDVLAEEVTLTGTKGAHVLSGQDIKSFFKQDGENLWSRAFKISGSSAPTNSFYVIGAKGEAENLSSDVVLAINSGGEKTVIDSVNCVLRGKDGDVVISANGGTVTEAADSIVISGAGWGHGVGMSQCGAYGMASQGFDYKEILKYYYKGIDVK